MKKTRLGLKGIHDKKITRRHYSERRKDMMGDEDVMSGWRNCVEGMRCRHERKL